MATMTSRKEGLEEVRKNGGQVATTTGAKKMAPAARPFPFFLSRMREEFDQLLERLFRSWPMYEPTLAKTWRWGLEVEEQDDQVVVRAEAPGFEPGDFELQVRDNQLTLRGHRQAETKEKEGKFQHLEERECYETVTLPPGIAEDKVTAAYHNGILTVILPRKAENKGRRIPIAGK